MPIKKLRPEFSITEERLKELQRVVPEAFADGKVNWEALKEALGEFLEDESQEHFGLTWPGKREARRLAGLPSKGTLTLQEGEGVNEEDTHNVFIEGENLEVLKVLQKPYAGRIKMIYIDPPYNTGNDFIFSDDFIEPLDGYLRRAGKLDESGSPITSNTRSAGRFHSNWLSMMMPRLLLSKNLLTADGHIFISIDDNEFANLKTLCDEIFGSENFIGTMIRQTIEGGKQDTKTIQSVHEYLIVYAKDSEHSNLNRKQQTDFDHYDKKDGFFEERGFYYLKPLENRGLGYIKSLDYPILGPDNQEIYPGGEHGNNGYRWVWSKEKLKRAMDLEMVAFIKGQKGGFKVYYKTYQFMDTEGSKIDRTVPYKSLFLDSFTNRQSGNELRALFEGIRVFDYAKPSSFISELIKLGCKDGDIVLDFFCGSGTTAHSALRVASEEKIRLQFIMVQMHEQCEMGSEPQKAGFETIAQIGKERIRRVVKILKEQNQDFSSILGFSCFELQKSSFKDWTTPQISNLEQIQMKFDGAEAPLVDGWEPRALITEILLIHGFPLDSKVVYQEEVTKNHIYKVSSDFHDHNLFVCLDTRLDDLIIHNLNMGLDDIFVCLETALSDESKLRLADFANLNVI